MNNRPTNNLGFTPLEKAPSVRVALKKEKNKLFGGDQKPLPNFLTGFTLIEVMVVVIILGILAAVVVPRLTGRTEQAKITRAAVDIKNVEASLELFNLDNGFYPSTEQGLEALVKKPDVGRIPLKWNEEGYLKKIPLDPWGKEYQYLSPGAHGKYDLYSLGVDGELGGEGKDGDIKSWEL